MPTMAAWTTRSDSLADLPRIETARLSIAALAPADARALRRLTDDPAVTAAIDFLPTPFTLRDAEDLIRGGHGGRDRFFGAWARAEGEGAQSAPDPVERPAGGSLPGAAEDRPEGPLLGVVGAHLRGPGAIEIGYWVGGAARGRGVAFEAVSGLLALLTRRFPARSVVAECRPGNVASWGLLHKLGFHETGEAGHRPGRRLLRRAGGAGP